MLNVVVTGGSGFIGSNVTEQLKGAYHVTVFDTRDPRTKVPNFSKGSVLNLANTIRTTKDCNTVVHLAGIVGVEQTESNPIGTLDVNIIGTRNILEACRVNDVTKLIFASSSEVYGQALRSPVRETAQPRPISKYGISKLVGEEYVLSFSGLYGMKFTILRFFNVYGPGQSSDFVIPRFIDFAVREEPITMHGDGSQVRSFCHVRDASNSVFLAMHKGDNQILNIGNDAQPITIKQLARTIVSIVSSRSKLVYKPFPLSGRKGRREIFERIPDITKAKSILDYEPRVSLKEGLTELVQLKRDKA